MGVLVVEVLRREVGRMLRTRRLFKSRWSIRF